MDTSITEIKAGQIFDSRGNPTVRCRVVLKDGSVGVASVPSGASTGSYEAVELRDRARAYGGKGVLLAVGSINGEIKDALMGLAADEQREIDRRLLVLDGTENKERLGANATLAVSLACAKAAAASHGLPLYKYLGGGLANRLPRPFLNVLNGGRHAEGGLAIQEYMIVPVSAASFSEAMRMASECYHALGVLLREDGYRISLGDEGGFAPALESDEEALRYLVRSIEYAGYEPGQDVFLALDVAANEWYEQGKYRPIGTARRYTAKELSAYYQDLLKKFPILSLEDPFAEEDFDAFSAFTKDAPKGLQIVGDDLFVTNEKRLKKGIATGSCNCVLIKPNQVGTLSETADTVALAQRHGYKVMLSHRSGETEDAALADLAVAFSSGQIKAGAPARSERLAKYNRLLEIEEELGENARYG